MLRKRGFLAGLALLAAGSTGCSTHPITGRDQIIALAGVQAAHAEAGYAFSAGVQRFTAEPSCEQDCGSSASLANFAERAAAIGAQLGPAAHDLSPDLFGRIGRFAIEVDQTLG